MPQLDLITSLAIETFTHSIQALFLLGFAALLLYYYSFYRRDYLRYWSFACFAFGPSELIRALAAAPWSIRNQPWDGPVAYRVLL